MTNRIQFLYSTVPPHSANTENSYSLFLIRTRNFRFWRACQYQVRLWEFAFKTVGKVCCFSLLGWRNSLRCHYRFKHSNTECNPLGIQSTGMFSCAIIIMHQPYKSLLVSSPHTRTMNRKIILLVPREDEVFCGTLDKRIRQEWFFALIKQNCATNTNGAVAQIMHGAQ